jgi:deoxyribonuclease (pyrimidine dimer)
MTRINVGVLPQELNNRHLLAEAREIKRIPNCVGKGKFNMDNQPLKFKLGTGHVKFFYDKLGYLKNRYESLYKECVKRGFNVQYYGNAWDNIPNELLGDYNPTKEDRELILERINERLSKN